MPVWENVKVQLKQLVVLFLYLLLHWPLPLVQEAWQLAQIDERGDEDLEDGEEDGVSASYFYYAHLL